MKRYPKYKDSGIEWIVEIPEHWKIVKLKRATQFLYGVSLSNENRLDGKVPVYGSNGVTGYHNEAITESPCIVIGRKGSFGKVNYSDKECFPIDTTFYIDTTATHNDLRWLYYLLLTVRLDSFSKDSAVPGLNREEAYERIITLPPFSEQQSIANYLDRKTRQIDTLIEKKQKLIDLLKEQRAAIINQAVTKGLNPNVKLKDSGIEWLGEIPEHWIVAGMTKYIKSIVDYRGRTPEKIEGGVFLVTARNIKEGKIDYSLSQEYISQSEYERIMTRGIPQIGDVLFTTEAPLGEVANVDDENIALAQRIIKFRGNPDYLDDFFLKYWILSEAFQNDLQSYATGSTALGIKASKLNFLRIALPPLTEQKKIVSYLDDISFEFVQLIGKHNKSIDHLKEYRTALISEVVTGKIDVRDVGEQGDRQLSRQTCCV